jgi:GNAT superfamily N-acetyltransferase
MRRLATWNVLVESGSIQEIRQTFDRTALQMRFDKSYREEVRLRNGEVVILRPVRPDDKELLLRGFARLSGRSRYARFMSPRKGFTDSELAFLTEVDGESHFAIGATRLLEDGSVEGIAVARFIRLPADPTTAEPAITVIDDYQGQGLGTVLLARLVAAARERGVLRFHCEFLAENRNIRALLDEYADAATYHHDHETMTMDFRLPAPRPTERVRDLVRAGPMQRALKHAAGGILELRQPDDALDEPED